MKSSTLAAIALMALATSACSVDINPEQLRDRLENQAIKLQVAMQGAVDSSKSLREVEDELAEQEAIEEAQAHLQEAAQNEAQTFEDAKRDRAAARQDPLAGAPASELSSQLAP